MAVERFKTFEQARQALWLAPGDLRLPERMRRLAELARTSPVPRGVRRFRTIEEAKASA